MATFDEGLEAVPNTDAPYPRYPEEHNGYGDKYASRPGLDHTIHAFSQPASSDRLCGLRRTTFWLVMVIVVLVVAGAIGGGIGGWMVEKKVNRYAGSKCYL
jgi:hypothetical protein